ncbi:hypothetical protein N7508_007055 [Penicillium antarcticum]|uniref:uncharacterized protein n=1 Tax=Penicillium antarcticum TaxID=416450 RepID=UPI00239BE207|nr:uncharacterized protein N7508_007055 [Penicillium antarcticum]KAJ5302192.1 hypothetical protein N7508_007055 [Penicillium antarcticum]
MRRGCYTCRLRHLKCDKSGTNCLRCQKSGLECLEAPEKPKQDCFKHGQNPSLRGKGPPVYGESALSFAADQIWMDPSSEYSFQDETDEIASEYCVISVPNEPLRSRPPSECRYTPSSSTEPPAPVTIVTVPLHDTKYQASSHSTSAISPRSPSAQHVVQQRLKSMNEAYLLRHFQMHLAPWLDAGDPKRHFVAEIADRASQSPLLLSACLAVSAMHLSQTTRAVSTEVADSYHERCILIMLPSLDKSALKISIDILLSTTVILRFFEQISSYIPSIDPQRHLLAGSVYISSHVDCAISGGLASASFWVFVIQDIQFALTYRKSLRLAFAPFDERLRCWWASKQVLSVSDWVNRAIWLLAETIDFCYNVSGRNYGGYLGRSGRIALKKRILEWENGRPDAFMPLHVSPPDRERGNPFPVVLHMNLWHSTAVQHICLAKALVLIDESEETPENQAMIRFGFLIIQEQISQTLNYLFGVALSADDEPSLRIMACHTLSACSAWINDPLAQTVLFDLLRRTDRDNGWPWAYVEDRILRTWQESAI